MHTFNPDRDIPALEKELGGTLNAMNPDLRAVPGAWRQVDYVSRLGRSAAFALQHARLLRRRGEDHGRAAGDGCVPAALHGPGMEHCRGGPGPDTFDAVASLDDWVEHGVPPERIIASHKGADGKTADRTRPLCRYPQVARYKGSGSTDEAASFSCQTL